MAAIMGEGLITASCLPLFSASPYFAARAFPIMRPKVTERPQQLPVDILRVGIVRTRVDARDVQAFNRLAIVVDSL